MGILVFTSQVSPTFAQMLRNISGISLVTDWLSSTRTVDGVKNAAEHEYTPFTPVTWKLDQMQVTLSDVYLTSEMLIYKVLISDDNIENHMIQNPDGSQGLDQTAGQYNVQSIDFQGIEGSSSQEVIYDEKTRQPVLAVSYAVQLTSEEVQSFLNEKPESLRFKLFVHDDAESGTEKEYALQVPFHSSQWMEDKVIPVSQTVEIKDDPDIRSLVVENLRITPLNTYLELRLDNSDAFGLDLNLARNLEDQGLRLTDNNGKVYPLDTYRLKYQPTHHAFKPGLIELTFVSSPYFDPTVERLTFHLPGVEVSDWTESNSVSLSMGEELPKTFTFKDHVMQITEARYEDGFLKLHVVQPNDHKMRLRFDITSFMKQLAESPELTEEYYGEKLADRKDMLVPSAGVNEYDLSIMAPEQDHYDIRVKRDLDEVHLEKEVQMDIR
ncbi:hypothetical protein [Paenibacillus sp. TY11]|uniref:hypothetical protein n=1 Tax=Paenibacillus sp. TY11 TaxID=3448633 RepID=UPI00403A682E